MVNDHALKKYKCTICEKDLSYEGGLRRHINLIHKGISPTFDCQYKNCDYVTKLKQNILVHQRIHDKHMGFIHERNYKCDICENTFSTTKGLKNHYKKH